MSKLKLKDKLVSSLGVAGGVIYFLISLLISALPIIIAALILNAIFWGKPDNRKDADTSGQSSGIVEIYKEKMIKSFIDGGVSRSEASCTVEYFVNRVGTDRFIWYSTASSEEVEGIGGAEWADLGSVLGDALKNCYEKK